MQYAATSVYYSNFHGNIVSVLKVEKSFGGTLSK